MDSVFLKGIRCNDTIYRIMNEPFDGDIIKNTTSWSLSPIEHFCRKQVCHLYVAKLPKHLKVMYVENNSKDKNLKTFQEFNIYEFEFLLPRNLQFEEIKTKKITIPNHRFIFKNKKKNDHKDIQIIVHYIKILKQKKIKNENLVKDIPLTLVTQ